MEFQVFRKKFEEQLDPNCFKVVYPKQNKNHSKYFWITVVGTGIGSELCHYEFIQDGNQLNLEIHFEFGTPGDYNAVSKLLGCKLFGKPLVHRYTSQINPVQVGITYKTFDLASETLIKDTRKELNKMNSKIQKELPKLLQVFYKTKKIRKLDIKNVNSTISIKTIYFTLMLSILLVIFIPFILIFLNRKSNFPCSTVLKDLFMNINGSILCASLSLIVIVSIVCLTILSIKMLRYIITIKKMDLISQIKSENISDENVKTFINSISDL